MFWRQIQNWSLLNLLHVSVDFVFASLILWFRVNFIFLLPQLFTSENSRDVVKQHNYLAKMARVQKPNTHKYFITYITSKRTRACTHINISCACDTNAGRGLEDTNDFKLSTVRCLDKSLAISYYHHWFYHPLPRVHITQTNAIALSSGWSSFVRKIGQTSGVVSCWASSARVGSTDCRENGR